MTSSGNTYRREECIHAFPWITELNDREGVAAVAKTDNSQVQLNWEALRWISEDLDISETTAMRVMDDLRMYLRNQHLGWQLDLVADACPFSRLSKGARGSMAMNFCRRRELQWSIHFDISALRLWFTGFGVLRPRAVLL